MIRIAEKSHASERHLINQDWSPRLRPSGRRLDNNWFPIVGPGAGEAVGLHRRPKKFRPHIKLNPCINVT